MRSLHLSGSTESIHPNTIVLGDCLDAMPLILPYSVGLVLCDPPYGTTNCAWDSVIDLEAMWKLLSRLTLPKTPIVFFASQPFTSILITSNLEAFRYTWVWQKDAGTGFLNAKKQPLRDHEDICVFYREQTTYNPQFTEGDPYSCLNGSLSDIYNERGQVYTENTGFRYPKTVQKFARESVRFHPTQKPEALLDYLIKTYTHEGQIVLDFTMGSGSTGVSAIKNKRRFIGIEKDEAYFEIAKKRIFETFERIPKDVFEIAKSGFRKKRCG